MRTESGHPRYAALLALALIVAAVFRFAWPLADPPEAMSWSSGSFTDPPANVLAARYAVQGGPGRAVDVPARLLYPALDVLARVAYRTLGVRRLATVVLAALLGIASVAFLSLALRRGPGERPAVWGAVLAAVSSWLVPNSRILMPESLAAFFLLIAAWLAISRRSAEWFGAGAAAAAGALLGKYHALAFLPALWFFLWLRSGRRAAIASFLGALLVVVVWVATIFAPHRADILQWFTRTWGELGGSSHSFLPAGGWATPFLALDQSWIMPVMPFVSAIGAWFAWRTVGSLVDFRARLEDGSALFVLWALCSFAFTALLPYDAPRYFTLVTVPLVACAACQISAILHPSSFAWPRRFATPALFAWIWFALFAALNVGVRLEAALRKEFFLAQWLTDPSAPPTFSKLYGLLGPIPRQAVMSGVAALPVLAILLLRLRRPSRARKSSPAPAPLAASPGLGVALLVVVLAWDIGWWAVWAAGRSTTIEDAKRSMQAVLSPDAVILGGFAPLLTEGSSLVAVQQFGTFQPNFLERYPRPTHLLLLDADLSLIYRVKPDLVRALVQVERWPIRATWAKSVALYRVPDAELPPGYRPSTFEQARAAVESGDLELGQSLLDEQRRTRGDTTDAMLLEARCRVDQGDLAAAEKLYLRAAADRPRDTLPLRNLGALALARGDTLATRALWLKALSIDPNDTEIAELFTLASRPDASRGRPGG